MSTTEIRTDERVRLALECIWAGVPDGIREHAMSGSDTDTRLIAIPAMMGALKRLGKAIELIREGQ